MLAEAMGFLALLNSPDSGNWRPNESSSTVSANRPGCGSFSFEATAWLFNRIDEECRVHTLQMKGISSGQRDMW
jgi:hypothetical protein